MNFLYIICERGRICESIDNLFIAFLNAFFGNHELRIWSNHKEKSVGSRKGVRRILVLKSNLEIIGGYLRKLRWLELEVNRFSCLVNYPCAKLQKFVSSIFILETFDCDSFSVLWSWTHWKLHDTAYADGPTLRASFETRCLIVRKIDEIQAPGNIVCEFMGQEIRIHINDCNSQMKINIRPLVR